MRTCAWIETSSAETGSSATMNSGLSGQGPRDADALALAAAELVRVAPDRVLRQADQLEQLAHPSCSVGALGQAVHRSGSASMDPIVMRGFREAVRVLEDHLHPAPHAA